MLLRFFRAGGFSMWTVLAFALATIWVAVGFARRPEPRRLALVRALTWVEVFAMLAGVTTNVMVVLYRAAREEDPTVLLLQGFAESITPLVLGCSLLVLAWLAVAIGVRRSPDDNA
ncbi:MAG: hypothetical protein K8W52_46255 [Deltaproteobacteria bacterium]|nr:hypothetical protein [Deltaproteobacteria bacterium]